MKNNKKIFVSYFSKIFKLTLLEFGIENQLKCYCKLIQ